MEKEAMLNACSEYITERVLPLMHVISDNSAVVLGSGFIIEHKNVKYLITAKHVLEENNKIEYEKIAFPALGKEKNIYSLPHEPYFTTSNTDADFAVVPLVYDKEILSKFYWKTFSMDSFYIDKDISENKEIIVHGFPSSLQTDTIASPFINIGIISFLTKKYTGNYDSIQDYSAAIDIIFEYKNIVKINNEMIEMPNLKGISGSPMFCLNTSSQSAIWSPEKNLKIVGIEKAVLKGKYIRATNSICLYNSLKKLFDKIEK